MAPSDNNENCCVVKQQQNLDTLYRYCLNADQTKIYILLLLQNLKDYQFNLFQRTSLGIVYSEVNIPNTEPTH